MDFEFATATRIIFGPGKLAQVGQLGAQMGAKALVVTGNNPDRVATLFRVLDAAGVAHVSYTASGEPTIDAVQNGVSRLRRAACDLVISVGGGSVLDTGKGLATLATNPGEPLDYLEVIGRGQAISQPPLPHIAIPTTAGTGAEVTRNAVLLSPEHQVKVSLRSALMLPRVALIDPELTFSMPAHVTASTGLDALTQVLEPFVSINANPLTDALCREGLQRVSGALRVAYAAGQDAEARSDMALVSLLGGLALANAKLGAVHGFAGPLGGMFSAPHGAICARLLPFVMAANVGALQAREPESRLLARYDEAARLLTGKQNAKAADGVDWVRDLVADLNIPILREYGVLDAHLPTIVEKAAQSSSMKGNSIKLTNDELADVLSQAL